MHASPTACGSWEVTELPGARRGQNYSLIILDFSIALCGIITDGAKPYRCLRTNPAVAPTAPVLTGLLTQCTYNFEIMSLVLKMSVGRGIKMIIIKY
jgi:hypothetical protein